MKTTLCHHKAAEQLASQGNHRGTEKTMTDSAVQCLLKMTTRWHSCHTPQKPRPCFQVFLFGGLVFFKEQIVMSFLNDFFL